MINIPDTDRQLFTIAPATLDCLLQGLLTTPPVGQTGQHIDKCPSFDQFIPNLQALGLRPVT
ncbi:hypothetical protein [Chloroflexus sp.]|uniref:hypothetical protein n=1 Tax=Chloroflexus sp. TaxID=1904827 RepID=UPI002ACE2E4F|nr:hypothetical protein [Chloroflexus sp.]